MMRQMMGGGESPGCRPSPACGARCRRTARRARRSPRAAGRAATRPPARPALATRVAPSQPVRLRAATGAAEGGAPGLGAGALPGSQEELAGLEALTSGKGLGGLRLPSPGQLPSLDDVPSPGQHLLPGQPPSGFRPPGPALSGQERRQASPANADQPTGPLPPPDNRAACPASHGGTTSHCRPAPKVSIGGSCAETAVITTVRAHVREPGRRAWGARIGLRVDWPGARLPPCGRRENRGCCGDYGPGAGSLAYDTVTLRSGGALSRSRGRGTERAGAVVPTRRAHCLHRVFGRGPHPWPSRSSSSAWARSMRLFYRIIVADARTKRDGRAIEEIGKYHPKNEPLAHRGEL